MTPADLADVVLSALRASVEAGELSLHEGAAPTQVRIERPKKAEHGDYATNVAMQLARHAGRPPREIAETLKARLVRFPGIEAVDVAGPGFLNITVAAAAQGDLARRIVEDGSAYGHSGALAGEKVNLEFVSANPTGPLHLGHARWAAVGDALARLLSAAGAEVTREYYVNDAGAQIDSFGESLYAASAGEPTPEGGYGGAYVGEIAAKVTAGRPEVGDMAREQAVVVFREDGYRLMLSDIMEKLHEFGVDFDVYFSERELHESGRVEKALDELRAQRHVYDADGAVWLRTTDFGDDKDRVLVRSDGTTTYFASDAAYYLDKRHRGFLRNVYFLGADHHGYVGRLKAIAACAGDDPARNIEVLIGQMVNLVEHGVPVKMSKRAGTIVTLEDLVDMVGVDAARYHLARSSIDSTLTLDVDLLTAQKNENPVYYVQYVAARTASVTRNAADMGVERGAAGQFRPELLDHEKEGDLLGALGEFPRVVASAAELREPHRVARYLEQLAGTYHRFYDACRILPYPGEQPTDLTRARLWLNDATRVVIANGLGLLGVSAPERM